MATTVTINGVNYSIPAVGEGNWGNNVSNYLIALSSGLLQKAGGSFTLTADVDFGANFGLKAIKFSSRGTPSTVGVVRLGNNESVGWRNAGNAADLELKVNTSDILEFNGNPLLTLALGAANTVLNMNAGGTAYEWDKIVDANIDASAAIDATKIAGGGVSNTVFGYLVGVTSSIQTQLNAKIDDFAGTTDNAIVRTNGVGGDAIQESGVTINDTDDIAGVNDITLSGDIDKATAAALAIGGVNATTINISRAGQLTVIKGDLQIDGTTTTVNSQTLDVADANITVNVGGNQASADGTSGLTVEMSDATDVVLLYDSTLTSRWKIGDTGSESEIIVASGSQTITGSKTFNDALTLNQIATPANPASGYNKVYAKTDDKLYYLNSSGTEQEIGAGSGSGSINFITNGDFEDGTTTGWSTYDDGASATPVDGTGGVSSNITLSSESTVELNGDFCLKITKGAADAQGEGGSFDFTIPKAYRGIKNAISLVYSTDGTYTAGDAAIFLYDVDTSTLITPRVSEITGYDKDNPGAVKYRTDFDIADTTSVNYRFIIHVTSTNASAWDLYVDDVGIGPESYSQGQVVGPWTSFTPTLSNGGSLVFNTAKAVYREVGDSIEIRFRGNVTTTGSGASAVTLDIPNSFNVDEDNYAINTREGDANLSLKEDSTNIVKYSSSYANSSTTLVFVKPGVNALMTGADFSTSGGAGFYESLDLFITLPISELQGKTVANLGANDVEHAATNGTWDADDSSTVYGAGGAAMGGALTAARTKTITWQTDHQAGDVITLLFSEDGVAWSEAASTIINNTAVAKMISSTGTILSGAWHEANGSNSSKIFFGQYLRAANDDAPTTDWPSSNAYWKVTKARSGIPVSFGQVTSSESGLAPPQTTQQDLTVTGTGWTTTRAVGLAYKDFDGNWRLKFNICGTVSSSTRTTYSVQISGITTKNVSSYFQAITGDALSSSATHSSSSMSANGNTCSVTHASATTTTYAFSGDVELDSKPTWA